MKKFAVISVFACLFLTVFFVFKATAINDSKSNITFNSLLSKVTKKSDIYEMNINNIDKNIYEIQIENIQNQVKDVTDEMQEFSKGDSEYYEKQLEIFSLEKTLSEYELEYEYCLKNEDIIIKQVKNKLKQKYYQLYLQNSQLELYNKSLDFYKFNLSVSKDLFNQGKITENDVNIAEISLLSAKNTVDTSIRDIDLSKKSISVLLNQHFLQFSDFELALPNDLEAFELSESKLISEFTKKNSDILKLENMIKIEKEYLENIKSIYPLNSNSLKIQENIIDKYSIELQNLKAEYSFNISQKYNEYLTLSSEFETLKKYETVLLNKMEINQSLFDMGKISERELLKENLDLSFELMNKERAFVDLLLVKEELILLTDGVS